MNLIRELTSFFCLHFEFRVSKSVFCPFLRFHFLIECLGGSGRDWDANNKRSFRLVGFISPWVSKILIGSNYLSPRPPVSMCVYVQLQNPANKSHLYIKSEELLAWPFQEGFFLYVRLSRSTVCIIQIIGYSSVCVKPHRPRFEWGEPEGEKLSVIFIRVFWIMHTHTYGTKKCVFAFTPSNRITRVQVCVERFLGAPSLTPTRIESLGLFFSLAHFCAEIFLDHLVLTRIRILCIEHVRGGKHNYSDQSTAWCIGHSFATASQN